MPAPGLRDKSLLIALESYHTIINYLGELGFLTKFSV